MKALFLFIALVAGGTLAAQNKEVKLKDFPPNRTDWIKVWLIYKIHKETMYDDGPNALALKEDLTMDENKIRYKLIRRNHNVGIQPGESPDGFEGQSGGVHYVNEVDTIEIESTYKLIALDTYEPPQTINVVIAKPIRKYLNHSFVYQGKRSAVGVLNTPLAASEYKVSFRAVSRNPSITFLKAKVTDLEEQDIEMFDKAGLEFFKNHILAAHGQTFSPEVAKDFIEYNWYRPLYDDVTPMLNEFEKRNVEFITKTAYWK